MTLRFHGVALAFVSILASAISAQPPANTSTVVLENNRIRIERVELAPRAARPVSIPQDSLLIALAAGDAEVSSATQRAFGGRVAPGQTWWWPKAPAMHSITNVGERPLTLLQVRLKENEADVGKDETAPRPAVVPGIVTLFENSRVFVEKLTFPAGRRTDPPGKSHLEYVPRDVMIVALTRGDYEVNSTGERAESGQFQPGKVWWWPKPPATHSIANIGKQPYDFVKISLK